MNFQGYPIKHCIKRIKISDHAIKRYKKRIGRRTGSRKNISRDISQALSNAKFVYNFKTGQYRAITDKFTAVCEGDCTGLYVVTVFPNDSMNEDGSHELQMYS